ncbi:hypothetical protein GCM10023221_12570 [Luteimicrobium xylanilyticum]|uniref:Serine aminopeptidase S33 domain-containing protein n=1 Tax=Luteimicrobium xylanilyticum TaxID=1133546 RepID=A0A5P9QDZ1_9MICO|nr:alpha/beta fold hydrolase [Luteimicrobium xylanilyticum]QFU99270.1 hypothetical protein KDY119_02797 [Luteimicrobium xylanilyticum]
MTENGSVSVRSGDVVETATWFGPEDRPLFGWLTAPSSNLVRGAVVLCQPLAEEGNMAYRTMRTLSQELARVGLLALRFDYDGTGDSAGEFNDPGRRDAWIGSVREAVEYTRSICAGRVTLVGMRLGANIAFHATEDVEVDELLLWDPCESGNSFLRELRLVHSPWLEGRERSPEGWIETPSYAFSPESAEAVRDLGLHDAGQSRAPLAVTWLARSDRPIPNKVRAALGGKAPVLIDGQAGLLNVPTLSAAVPSASVSWIVRHLEDSRGGEGLVEVVPRVTAAASWLNWSGARFGTQASPPTRVLESARVFDTGADVFGIVSESAAAPDGAPWVVFPNVAKERHLGEGRQWVTLARALAAHGFRCLRFDHSGVGDSGAHPGQDEEATYSLYWLDDLDRIVTLIRSGGARRVVGIGLCSSGSAVLEAALKGKLTEAITINTFLLLEPGSEPGPPSQWRSFRRMPRPLRRLARRHRRTARSLYKALGTICPPVSPLWVPRQIVRRSHCDLTLMVGADDSAQLDVGRPLDVMVRRPLERTGHFEIVALANADHSLRVTSGQDEVSRHVLERLLRATT